jgi:uncharacterized membrane protein
MTTVDSRGAEIADYLAGVRAALADLPPAQLDALLEDLPEHISEVAASDPRPLHDRLGSPASFAAETRAAAGLPMAGPAVKAAATSTSALDHLRALLTSANVGAGRLLGYERATLALPPLRPGWRLIRGALIAWWLLFLAGVLSYTESPGRLVTMVFVPAVFIVAIIASIRLGRAQDTNPAASAVGIGASLLAVVATVYALWVI